MSSGQNRIARGTGESLPHSDVLHVGEFDVTADVLEDYRQIGSMVQELADATPVDSDERWKQRVLAKLDRPRRKRWPVVVALALGAAAVVIVIATRTAPQPPTAPQLSYVVTRPAASVRGGGVAVGDTITFEARSTSNAEIRLYDDNGVLVGKCGATTDEGCRLETGSRTVTLRYTLTASKPGAFRPILYGGPPTSGLMDQDLAVAKWTISAARIVVQ